MQVAQADFRTVHIRKDDLSFFLRYNLYQDGEERFPESINCREDTVVAYFLTSTIRDYLRETAWGFAVERSWAIVPEGQFALSFCIDLPEPAPFSLLLPAASAASGAALPPAGLAASGQDTAVPNGAYILGDTRSVLVFADPLPEVPGPGSVRGHRALVDEEPMLRTEIRLPGLTEEEPEAGLLTARASRPSRRRTQPLAGYFAAAGNYEQALRFNVVAATAATVFHRGVEAAIERVAGRARPRRMLDRRAAGALAEEAVQGCLDTHLVHEKGVHGLRTVPGAAELSSAAGVALANLLLEVFPGNEVMLETALRLADFTLKGQHPGGLFYGAYYLSGKSWLQPGAGTETPPQVRLEETAEIACSLLRLAEALQALDRPAERCWLAGERMGEALLASRADLAEVGDALHPDSLLSVGHGNGAIALIELLVRLHRHSGRDAYKKALSALARRFYGQPPEPHRAVVERAAAGGLSLEADLLQARGAALLFESGYRPRGLADYLSRLLPWICVNLRTLPDGLSMVGGVVDTLGAGRLAFRGFELAYTALRLQRCLGPSKEPRTIGAVVPRLLGFTLQKPIGTAWLAMDPGTKDPVGPVDSRVLIREIEALLRLREEFPVALESAPDVG